jgi:hypothetical protein
LSYFVLARFDSFRSQPLLPAHSFTNISLPAHIWRSMKPCARVISKLSKWQPKFFKVLYSPEYKTFIQNYVVADQSHPLHQAQKRLSGQRKREGLWWHVTTAGDLSKSSCVRSWSRRRLRNAIVEELRLRGYDDNGKLLKTRSAGDVDGTTQASPVNTCDIEGSLRLHALAPLIPAKFIDVKAEVGNLVDALLEARTPVPSTPTSDKKPLSKPKRNTLPKSLTKKSQLFQQRR